MGQATHKTGIFSLAGGSGRTVKAPFPVGIIGRLGAAATALALQADPEGSGFHLVLLDGTKALLTLGPYAEEDVVAEWRALGAAAGLPLTVRFSNGSVMALCRQVGRLQVGPLWPRSRHKLLTSRRPRFLTRRKTGCFPQRPRIFREAEIVPRQGI
ncbi:MULTISPECIES: DUF6101 family protein [Microvirga]|uniref:DUF6101 family protein n=1 Tax=Microvirga TaxID=186650 RepID=UPI001CFFC902|nr:DUF6101 family protein [Microvirga lenta]MCB5175426.1 DUF6101 family protein [Microvirga lenta]